MAETIEARARRGYDAYGGYVGWKNYAGLAMPTWEELPEKIRGAWQHATGVLVVDHDDSKTPSFADFAEVFQRIGFLLTGVSNPDIGDAVDACMYGDLNGGADMLIKEFRTRHTEFPQIPVPEEAFAEIQALAVCWNAHMLRAAGSFNRAGPGMDHGVYDHFKGGVYLSTDVWEWASGKCEPVVSYISLVYGRKFTRLAHEWQSIVKWPDGQYRSRFVYRGENLNVPEPAFRVHKEA